MTTIQWAMGLSIRGVGCCGRMWWAVWSADGLARAAWGDPDGGGGRQAMVAGKAMGEESGRERLITAAFLPCNAG